MSVLINNYKSELANYLNVKESHMTLFWKGRVALYALLKSFGISKDDEVILPAFTCVVVPNAILYCDAKPVYVDINPQTLNCDPEEIRKKITPKTKLIIAQNTFGLSSDLDAIMRIANEYHIVVIEDCTHGIGGYYRGIKNGTIADAAFFSSQWNKPFSTGIGGMAYVRDQPIAEKMNVFESNAIDPSFMERFQLSMLLKVRAIMKAPAIYWPMIKLYRFLSKNNLIVGSSQGNELAKPEIPNGFLKKMSPIQMKTGIAELKKLDQYVTHRKNIAKQYDEFLQQMGIKVYTHQDHAYLKYPILVKDRSLFLQLAEKKSIELGDWFISPIHPIEENYHLWNYEYGQFPIAENIAKHCINLPTNKDITPQKLACIISFLIQNKEQILSFD